MIDQQSQLISYNQCKKTEMLTSETSSQPFEALRSDNSLPLARAEADILLWLLGQTNCTVRSHFIQGGWFGTRRAREDVWVGGVMYS